MLGVVAYINYLVNTKSGGRRTADGTTEKELPKKKAVFFFLFQTLLEGKVSLIKTTYSLTKVRQSFLHNIVKHNLAY